MIEVWKRYAKMDSAADWEVAELVQMKAELSANEFWEVYEIRGDRFAAAIGFHTLNIAVKVAKVIDVTSVFDKNWIAYNPLQWSTIPLSNPRLFEGVDMMCLPFAVGVVLQERSIHLIGRRWCLDQLTAVLDQQVKAIQLMQRCLPRRGSRAKQLDLFWGRVQREAEAFQRNYIREAPPTAASGFDIRASWRMMYHMAAERFPAIRVRPGQTGYRADSEIQVRDCEGLRLAGLLKVGKRL